MSQQVNITWAPDPNSYVNDHVADGMVVRRYGAGACPICTGFHESMLESGGSKAFVEILFQNMLQAYNALTGSQKKAAKCMIGALVPQGKRKVLIACSGSGDRPAFVAAARMMPTTVVCEAVASPVNTMGGRTITPEELASWEADNVPLQCAAPKLIMKARSLGYPQPWDMTEIWFDPLMNSKHFYKRSTGYTKHGWSIASCNTCAKVVPALLCTASG